MAQTGASGHSLHSPHHMRERGLSNFSEGFIYKGFRSNRNFGWVIDFGWIFFRGNLKTPCIKNSEYESQTKK